MPGSMPPQGAGPQGAPQPQGGPPGGAPQGKPPIPPSQAVQMIHDGYEALGPAIKQSGDPHLLQAVGMAQNAFMQLVQELGKPGQAQGGAAPPSAGAKGPMPQNASQGSQPAPQY